MKRIPQMFSVSVKSNEVFVKGRMVRSILLGLVLGLLGGGCVSPSFNRSWREAESPSNGAQRWEGRWESYVNGHHGKLRAVTRSESERALKAQFEAGWQCFVSAFDVSLDARRGRGRVELEGRQELRSCVGGGVYTYRGLIQGEILWAEYRSKGDHGLFEMRRVEALP